MFVRNTKRLSSLLMTHSRQSTTTGQFKSQHCLFPTTAFNNSIRQHQQQHRFYSSKTHPSEEEEHIFDETDLGNPFVNFIKATAFIGAGAYAGYLISDFVVEKVGFVPEDDDDDKKESREQDSEGTTTDYHKQFDFYADVEENGEKFLSPDAFIRSLLTPRPDTPSWVAYPRKDGKLLVDKRLSDEVMKLMFTYADADSDGRISFDEYSLFLTLVNSSNRRLKLAFEMFDLDGSGEIDLSEFKQVIDANKKDPNATFKVEDSGLAKQLFGPKGDQKVSFKEFLSFIEGFKDQLLLHEFLLHDVEGQNQISVEAFNELITQSVHFNSINVPQFKKQLNLLKTSGFFKPSGRVDFDTFKAFHKMSEHIDDLKLAMQLYTASGKDIRKDDFTRILGRVAGLKVPNRVVDLIFALFDKDGNGNLSYREFVSTLEQRQASALAQEE
jgi:Ca2+-binding EF-hand superfamily protein